ncbi:MAG: hypothetical protein MUC57_01180 [Desulfobacterales bacterium]|jgi:hypothetical protein|nr:hypothetical protein [Desulfobacterales bacterium]
MLDIVGETVAQQMARVILPAGGAEKDAGTQKVEAVREVRSVEETNQSENARSDAGTGGNTTTRNRLEEGKVIVEKYDEDGRLVRRTPPGFLPFGEIA